MSTDGQGTKCPKNTAENYNCLSRVDERSLTKWSEAAIIIQVKGKQFHTQNIRTVNSCSDQKLTRRS